MKNKIIDIFYDRKFMYSNELNNLRKAQEFIVAAEDIFELSETKDRKISTARFFKELHDFYEFALNELTPY